MNWQNVQESAQAWEKRFPTICEGFGIMLRVTRDMPDETVRLYLRDGDLHIVASNPFLDAFAAEMVSRYPDTARTIPGEFDLPDDAT